LWKQGYWINQKMGVRQIPKFYNEDKPQESDFGFRFPMQLASGMGAQSAVANFNVQSFLPNFLQQVN
jgi:hypothetical protein